MKLSTLPWFIKQDIIELVIRDDPSYCAVSKEWMRKTARLYGRVFYDLEKPEIVSKRTLFSIYIEKIWIGRVVDIDWDVLNSHQNIGSITLNIQQEYSISERDEFVRNFLKLPLVRHLYIHVHNDASFDATQILMRNHQDLKELSIPVEQFSRCREFESMNFINLTRLTLNSVTHTIELQDIVKNMPKLTKLCLESYEQLQRPLTLTREVINSVTELVLNFYHFGSCPIKVDLTKFPSLKKLESISLIDFDNFNSFYNLEELAVKGSIEHHSKLLSSKLTNLKILDLSVCEGLSSDGLLKILKLCTSLDTLKLGSDKEFEFPNTLPILPYTIANLYLQGQFSITSKFLHWLSDNFKLKFLEFRRCRLAENPLDQVAFNTLRQLDIYSYDEMDEFYDNFNKKRYPHVKSIDIKGICETCSHVFASFVPEVDDDTIS